MSFWEQFTALGLLLLGFGLASWIVIWMTPRPKPPEDEWDKWSKL